MPSDNNSLKQKFESFRDYVTKGFDELSAEISGEGSDMEDETMLPPEDEEMQEPVSRETGSNAGMSALEQYHSKGARRRM